MILFIKQEKTDLRQNMNAAFIVPEVKAEYLGRDKLVSRCDGNMYKFILAVTTRTSRKHGYRPESEDQEKCVKSLEIKEE